MGSSEADHCNRQLMAEGGLEVMDQLWKPTACLHPGIGSTGEPYVRQRDLVASAS